MAKWRAAGRRGRGLRVDLDPEAVGQPRQVIEDPDDVREFHVALCDGEGGPPKPAAIFDWIARDCTFVPELGHDPDIRVLPPLPDLTFEPKASKPPPEFGDDEPKDEFAP